MGILLQIIGFFISTLFSAFCLWAGMKLTKVKGSFISMLIIAGISGVVSIIFFWIPLVGWLLSTIVMFVLIGKTTDAEFWPDAVFMVLVAKAVAIGVSMFLAMAAVSLTMG